MSEAAQQAMALLAGNDRLAAAAALSSPIDAADHAVLGMIKLDAAAWDAARSHLLQACALGDMTPVTLLNLALAEDRLGPDGRRRMAALAETCPLWDEPPLRLAESYRRAGDDAEAIVYYEQVLDVNPDRTEALLGLAVLLLATGDAERAQSLLLRCCGVAPGLAEAWDALGVALTQTADSRMAEAAFARAQTLRPDSVTIALRRAGAALAAGGAEVELARLEQALHAEPLSIALLTARGVLLDRVGRPEEASDLLEVAVALAPDSALPAAAFAVSLLHAGHFLAAVPALRHAVALAPEEAALRNDLAAALNRVHRYREARDILELLIAEHGEEPAYLCNLCNALVSLGLQREGATLARHAAALAPEQSLSWRTLGNALVYLHGGVGIELSEASRRASAALVRPPRTVASLPTQPERRLRVGLLSAALKTHPVGWLTVAGFEALDPAQFELVCFGPPSSDDPLLRRFRAASSGWHTVTRSPANEVADLIRQQEIDILIELGGWGDQGMLAVCAQRPAPVQIKWVGMQSHSTGLPEIDWMITDSWETPDGFEPFYTERLLRLPDGYVCYSPSPLAPDVAPLPAGRLGHVTFGCFNNLAKITPDVVACWSTILHRVSGARLVLKAHQFSDQPTADQMRNTFASHGIDPHRVETRGSSSHRGQLLQHGDVDIMLDPFPYSGGLTTCESLWMGVPVVTLPGQTFASRHSTSHLCNVGLPDWVAPDIAAYQDIAVQRTAHLTDLQILRGGLRGRMRESPLCDAPRFGRNLGAALRLAWRQACEA